MTIEQEVNQKIDWCLLKAEQKLNKKFTKPRVAFSLYGKFSGLAFPSINSMVFNKQIAVENKENFLNITIPHEFSHLLAFSLYNKKTGHGSVWRNIMKNVFGLTPDKFHKYKTKHIPNPSKFKYRCTCGEITTVRKDRHHFIQLGFDDSCFNCKKSIRSSYLIDNK